MGTFSAESAQEVYAQSKDGVAGCQGSSRAGRTFANRLAREATERLPPNVSRAGWPNYVFAFHDKVDVSPVALAKIGKKTGLRPEDL